MNQDGNHEVEHFHFSREVGVFEELSVCLFSPFATVSKTAGYLFYRSDS